MDLSLRWREEQMDLQERVENGIRIDLPFCPMFLSMLWTKEITQFDRVRNHSLFKQGGKENDIGTDKTEWSGGNKFVSIAWY